MDLGRLHLSRIVDCCGTGGEKGTTWHVCDGLIGIVGVACLPGMHCDELGFRRFASFSSSCTETTGLKMITS